MRSLLCVRDNSFRFALDFNYRYPLHKRQWRRRAVFRSSATFSNITSLSFEVIHLENVCDAYDMWMFNQRCEGGRNGGIDGSIICCVCACVPHLDSHDAARMANWLAGVSYPIIILRNRWQRKPSPVMVAIRWDLWAIITCWSALQIIILGIIIGQAGQSIIQPLSQSVAFDNDDKLDWKRRFTAINVVSGWWYILLLLCMWDVRQEGDESFCTEYPCNLLPLLPLPLNPPFLL